jgi:predicted amidohydrolase
MTTFRIALANLVYPATPHDAVQRTLRAVEDAARAGARVVCFPEAYVPGYPWPGRNPERVDPSFLADAHATIAAAAGARGVGVVLGTERYVGSARRLTALVVRPDGEIAGYQDKMQLDPSEDAGYEPGSERKLFEIESVRFGVAICHEGFRYPETVRWAAQRGAQIVFHPHYAEAEAGSFRPTVFADPRNSFHEKAFLCRAAENGCFFAAVNCASSGSPTTSAVVRPDGRLLCHQPYGEPGLLVCDLDLSEATGVLAQRYRGPYPD